MTDKDISPKISIQHSIEKHTEYREESKMEKKKNFRKNKYVLNPDLMTAYVENLKRSRPTFNVQQTTSSVRKRLDRSKNRTKSIK